jgi:D-glycero-alpha-D-manno-heptose-7-phosphate kinase
VKTFEVKSPTRIDLAGGTLDCWPLYCFAGPTVTTNVSISIFTRARLEMRDGASIRLDMTDFGYRRDFTDLDAVFASQDAEIALVKGLLEHFRPTSGFHLTTSSESPVGGGLGGSSSLTVSLIRAFDRMLGTSRAVEDCVRLASDLEARVLNKLTGTQDYFPAADPGVCAIHYDFGRVWLEKLSIDPQALEGRLTVVFTGQSHHSGINNWQVIQRAVDGDTETLRALRDLRQIAAEVYRSLKAVDWESLGDLFRREYQARIRLSEGFSSPEIERLSAVARDAGAWATKICGAGGGGCVFVWSPEASRNRVEESLEAAGFRILPARLVQRLD